MNKSQNQITPTSHPGSVILSNAGIAQKAETDLYDKIAKFHQITLHKHDIDKIKTDERVQAADYAIKIKTEKIKLGMEIVEILLKERLKFIQQMQQNEQKLMQIMKETMQLFSYEKFDDFPRDQFTNYLKSLRDILLLSYTSFKSLNTIIHHSEKYYQQKTRWKTYCQQKLCINGYLMGLLNMNLIDVSNALYHKLKKYKIQLLQIHGGQEQENYVLNDEQLQKLLNFLAEINVDFADNVSAHLSIIVYQWIEDVTKVQSGYQINLDIYFNFLGQFESRILDKLYELDNLQLRCEAIQHQNEKAQKILKRMILPQKYDNYNIQLGVQIQDILNSNQAQVLKTKEELVKTKMIEIIILEAQEPDDTYKPIGQFKGAQKLVPKIIVVMQAMIQNKIINLDQKLNEVQLILTGVKQLFLSLKELLVAEKKLSKAQALYTNLKSTVENLRRDKSKINVEELYDQSLKLQKYVNILSEQANIALMISEQLPKISEFIQMIQRFITKQQFLSNDILRIVGIEKV
ncbi:unnamed protein product [Paramecium primaurelia]|uniref:Uncharacterized protein n=1 Tax=Paramecium primaurelia TaxID=5886 RepID=A0A8S1MRT6_PARPR|nr:unnamed protein product [Paramecium primaurelia]